jgi:hypothetical protein
MVDPIKADIRTVHRYLQREQLSQEVLDRHLAGLPDLAAQAVHVDYERAFREEKATALRDDGDGA